MSGILVVGSLNMDLVISAPRIPVMGETIHGNGFITVPGGKGANQAVAASRLGGDVTMIGCVGDDIFGNRLLDNLRHNGVNSDHIEKIAGIPTGVAVIVIKESDNFIILDSGANYSLTPEYIDTVEDVIRSCDIMLLQLEIPVNAVKRAIKTAKKYGVKVVLDPAPAAPLGDDILKNIDILTPNESESEAITKIKIKSPADAKQSINYFFEKGIKHAVITLGKNGVVYNNGSRTIHKSVPDVKVIDTTAAGDCFNAALAVALSEGMKMDEAIDFANMAGTLTVTKKGAQTSLPIRQDIEWLREDDNR